MKRKLQKLDRLSAAYPNVLQNGKCWFYVEKRLVRTSWGRKLFPCVKHVGDTLGNRAFMLIFSRRKEREKSHELPIVSCEWLF